MKNPIPQITYYILSKLKPLQPKKSFSSNEYWANRYAAGGNSGPGSYQHLAEFKANTLNKIVEEYSIRSAIEFGCGDGNQLLPANYLSYDGYDVSIEAINICQKRFHADKSKRFHLLSEYTGQVADLALSLDVIFHLVEDSVFSEYMYRLFKASSKYVVIYSSNSNEQLPPQSPHVRHRLFTAWVADNITHDWRLIKRISNVFPYNGDYKKTSFCDFYIYEKS